MRSLAIVSAVLAVGLLQGCQIANSGKPDEVTETAVIAPSPGAAVAQGMTSVRERARAYAARLNVGRCDGGPERGSFEAAEAELSQLSKSGVGTPAPEDPGSVLAQARIDVADAARNGGCADIATAQYKTVLRSFPGPAYARFRQQAELGLSALQL
jgi:hypothetical protein